MPVITLISDRKIDDFFLGRLKGQLLGSCKDLSIVDLAHNIGHHSVSKAAFILKNSYKNFPPKTVHLIGVDSECTPERSHLIVEANEQYFISADNGLFSLVFNEPEIKKIYTVNNCDDSLVKTPALFEFGRMACDILNGKKIDEFGNETKKIKKMLALNPISGDDFILGNMIYTDSYNNAVTNITFELFNEISNGRTFKIFAGSSGHVIHTISNFYQDVADGELVAIFNSLGLLEIAMNKDQISKLFSFDNTTKIRVEFHDSKNS